MSVALVLTLYSLALGYAVATYLVGDWLPLATIVLGFGLLLIPYLLMEWIATPMVAAIMGFQSRWSVPGAVLLGVPLVVLYTVVTPVTGSGSEGLPPVPWLAVFATGKTKVIPIIRERLVWWLGVYLLAFAGGLLSRRVRTKPRGADS